MNKLPKFLFCENPIADKSDGRQFILHARRPVILAEVFHFNEAQESESMECKRAFNLCATLDYPPEYIVLGAVWTEPIVIKNQEEANRLAGIMRRMADWYETYLIWEDSQDHNFNEEEL
jgi:hypothetical protein